MTPAECVAATKLPIGRGGGAWMLDPVTMQEGVALGLAGFSHYVLGRGGVLGEADGAVVAAAFAFWPHDFIAAQWDAGRAVMTPAEGLTAYAESCARWGRDHLSGLADADRLMVLARRVADAAETAALPLFAGWRAVPAPDDGPAAAALALQVLREHRGALHAVAVRVAGLSPLQAVMAGPGGRRNAKFFRWPQSDEQPYPDPEPLRIRWEEAERHTDVMAEPAYAVLDESERDELAGLLQQAHALV